MKLQPGMVAPDFQRADIFGMPIQLYDKEGGITLLSFFRNAACAICNLRVHQLIERYPAYQQRGLRIIAVFESPQQRILQYVGKQDAPFPIIADPQAELYTLYGVESSAAKVAVTMTMPKTHGVIEQAAAHGFPLTKEDGSNFDRMPADFLLSYDRRVIVAHYADYVMDHLPLARLEEKLWGFAEASAQIMVRA